MAPRQARCHPFAENLPTCCSSGWSEGCQGGLKRSGCLQCHRHPIGARHFQFSLLFKFLGKPGKMGQVPGLLSSTTETGRKLLALAQARPCSHLGSEATNQRMEEFNSAFRINETQRKDQIDSEPHSQQVVEDGPIHYQMQILNSKVPLTPA